MRTDDIVDEVGGHLPPPAVVEAVEEGDEVGQTQQHQHIVVAVWTRRLAGSVPKLDILGSVP